MMVFLLSLVVGVGGFSCSNFLASTVCRQGEWALGSQYFEVRLRSLIAWHNIVVIHAHSYHDDTFTPT